MSERNCSRGIICFFFVIPSEPFSNVNVHLSVSLVSLTMEHIPGSAFRTIKSYLKLRNVWVWDMDAVFLGQKSPHEVRIHFIVPHL